MVKGKYFTFGASIADLKHANAALIEKEKKAPALTAEVRKTKRTS